jgi:hypothetical protein
MSFNSSSFTVAIAATSSTTEIPLSQAVPPAWITVTYLSSPGGIQFEDFQNITASGQKAIVRNLYTFQLGPNMVATVTYPVAATTQVDSQPTTSLPVSSSTPVATGRGNISQTSAPHTSATSPASFKPDNGLAPGAVAGIAIGCLVCGALIAGILVWFCTSRRRGQRKDLNREGNAVAVIHHRDKEPTVKTISMESGSPITQAMETSLPQPLEDKIISGEIAKLDTSIKNHVHSFYHSSRVGPDLIDIDDLLALGSNLPISTGILSTLLGNSDTRELALRFCIAWVMISRMKLASRPDRTFLPPEVAECFQSIRKTPSGEFTYGGNPLSILANRLLAQPTLLMKWRAITAQILQSSYGQNWFAPSDLRGPNIEMALRILDPLLMPFADSRMDSKLRRQNLEEIFKRASSFAFTLFSQPSTFDYDWQEQEGVLSGSLCIFPALVQVTDENGHTLNPPRAFSEAVVRRLDTQ